MKQQKEQNPFFSLYIFILSILIMVTLTTLDYLGVNGADLAYFFIAYCGFICFWFFSTKNHLNDKK